MQPPAATNLAEMKPASVSSGMPEERTAQWRGRQFSKQNGKRSLDVPASQQSLPEPKTIKVKSTQPLTTSASQPSTAVPLYDQPVEMTLEPNLLPREALIYPQQVPERTLRAYATMKAKLENNPFVNVTFDDKNCTITFRHNEMELRSILEVEALTKMIQGSLTLTREYLTAKGRGFFMLGSRSRYLQQAEELQQAANKFLTAQETRFIPISPVTTVQSLIPELLKHQGFCIGEVHSKAAPKQFLIENMLEFKQLGVTTLFMEHLFYDSTQKWLDHYFHSPQGTPMPPYLKHYLDSQSNGQMAVNSPKHNYREVVRTAKEAGIRIVGIDTTVSILAGTIDKTGVEEDLSERLAAMNFVATNIIRNEAKTGKYIALMGTCHVTTYNQIPGVAELVHCPSLFISTEAHSGPQVETNVKNYLSQQEQVSAILWLANQRTVAK